MRRREFIAGLGSAVAWPVVARAQQLPPLLVVGVLNFVSIEAYADRIARFRQGLKDTGLVEGQGLLLEYRSADGHEERLPALAADLVRQKVAAIFALGGDAAALAAKTATSSIPIVFATGGDPIANGLVKSLSRPEANLTGVSFYSDQLAGKRLELLRDLLPRANPIAMLTTAYNPTVKPALNELAAASRAKGVEVVVLDIKSEQDIDAAFATIMKQRIGALVVQNDAFLNSRRDQIIALAARHALPAVYAYREHTLAGGLISYGTNVNEMYRPAGVYIGRILKGAKPADLPVLQPTKFELVINLKTAKALGLTIPETLLATADEVIQ
jgi:putative tryptophan/tyrosine transport system substrate-binding protein